MSQFATEIRRRGVYAIPVVAEGIHQGKILLKKSHPENKGKAEFTKVTLPSGAIATGNFALQVVLAQSIATLDSEMWELISGGIEDADADPVTALIREFSEEARVSISRDRLVSLESVSPENNAWLASIMVHQLREGQQVTFEAIGYAAAIFESDLPTFGEEGVNYILVAQDELRTFVLDQLLDKKIRPATAAMIIDLLANPQKLKKTATLASGVTNIMYPDFGLQKLTAGAGD